MRLQHYAVIGAGRQGVAAGYDLARWGHAAQVLLADANRNQAVRAAERINDLLGAKIATAVQLDVRDFQSLVEILRPLDVFICAVPFVFILDCTRAAIEAQTSMVDLGGHTATVFQQWRMNDAALSAAITVVPDCGMGPGMNNTLGIYVIEQLREQGAVPREIRVWDGGLPQQPRTPWGYQCAFNINGLTNEYDGQALFLREGLITPVDTLTEPEDLEFAGIGTLEAFVTSGGTSTVPYNYQGILQVYENKTLRYPGHYLQFKAFKDLGLFREEPLALTPGLTVIPRQLFHTLLAPSIETELVPDVCVMRATGVGVRQGQDIALSVDLVDYFDAPTGFTAMERLTGWHAAIMAQFIAQKEVALGVCPLEKALPATRFLTEVRRRGFQITEKWH